MRFEPADPNLQLYGVGDRLVRHPAGYPLLCNGPCTTDLEAGQYHFAIANGDGRLGLVPDPVIIPGPSTLHVVYKDRSGLRAAGAATFLIGVLAGSGMFAAATATEQLACDGQKCFYQPNALVGLSVFTIVTSVIVGYALGYLHDSARITVEPLRLGWTPREGHVMATSSYQGAALTMHF